MVVVARMAGVERDPTTSVGTDALHWRVGCAYNLNRRLAAPFRTRYHHTRAILRRNPTHDLHESVKIQFHKKVLHEHRHCRPWSLPKVERHDDAVATSDR